MGHKGAWDCVEKPVRQRSTPNDNFPVFPSLPQQWFILSSPNTPPTIVHPVVPTPPSNGSSCRPSTPLARVHPVIPLVPQQWFIQCYGQKSNHFHPWCSKFNFVWGGWGGVASFTNISRKVPTLLTSIVAKTDEFNFQLTALQSLEFTNSGAPRSEAPYLRKFGNLSIRENLVMTSAYDLPSVQTLGEGKGVRRQPVEGGVCYSLGESL